jgi:hypothetical protein
MKRRSMGDEVNEHAENVLAKYTDTNELDSLRSMLGNHCFT